MNKFKITHNCFVRGEAFEKGKMVEVDDLVAAELRASGRAVQLKAEQKQDEGEMKEEPKKEAKKQATKKKKAKKSNKEG